MKTMDKDTGITVETGNKDMIEIVVETGHKDLIEIMVGTGNKDMTDIMAVIDNRDMIDNRGRAPQSVKLAIGSLPIAYPTVTRNATSTMVVAISIKINIKVFLPVEADQEF